VFTNTPGVLTETTADLAFALLLGIARRLGEGERIVRSGGWGAWSPFAFLGTDVHHATLGIVGLGRIGSEVAKRASGFSMRILYTNRGRNAEAEDLYGCMKVDLLTLLRESDFVVVLVPLSAETRHLLSTTQFKLMKQSAFLINVSRGSVIDQRALYMALRDGDIAGAALDVTDPEPMPADDPLLTLENCLVVPHVGSASIDTRARMATLAAENIAALLNGQRPPTPVNIDALEKGGQPSPP
jgi:glyoxylate reductase